MGSRVYIDQVHDQHYQEIEISHIDFSNSGYIFFVHDIHDQIRIDAGEGGKFESKKDFIVGSEIRYIPWCDVRRCEIHENGEIDGDMVVLNSQ